MVSAGDHAVLRMSRQMAPVDEMLQWYTFVANHTCAGATARLGTHGGRRPFAYANRFQRGESVAQLGRCEARGGGFELSTQVVRQ